MPGGSCWRAWNAPRGFVRLSRASACLSPAGCMSCASVESSCRKTSLCARWSLAGVKRCPHATRLRPGALSRPRARELCLGIRIFEQRAAGKQYWKMRMVKIPGCGKIWHQVFSGTLLVMNQTSNPRGTVSRESEIEFLARETGTPVDTVKEIYRIERDKLERSARIQTFVSLLAHQRVRALLHVERRRRHGTSLVGQANNS
jgi:hypothetical protein